MAFRATNSVPGKAYEETKLTMVRLKSFCDTTITNISSGTNADVIVGTLNYLSSTHERLTTLKDTPGIGAYAKDQEVDQAYNISTEFNTALSLLDDALTWLRGIFPVDGDGYLLIFKLVSDRLEARTFTAGQAGQLVTRLQAISGSII